MSAEHCSRRSRSTSSALAAPSSQAIDDAVSYVRRVAQGRADLARDALDRSSDDGDPTPVYGTDDLQAGLRDVLADRLLAAGDRPPRPAEDFSDHPLDAELDALCAAGGFSRLDQLNRAKLAELVDALDAFEQRVSAQRRAVFAELDELTDELVNRYRDADAAGAGDADGSDHDHPTSRPPPGVREPRLGEFISNQREVASMSVRRLAELAGVSNPYLSQIERGLRRPSAEILQQLAKALKISVETLYVRAGLLADPTDEPAPSVREAIARDERSPPSRSTPCSTCTRASSPSSRPAQPRSAPAECRSAQ